MEAKSGVRKLKIQYTPPDVSCEIIQSGNVADRQVYNSSDGGFAPDYRMVHLVLFPKCNAHVSTEMSTSDCVNDKLTSIAWYELAYNEASKKYVRSSAIANGGSDYEIVQTSGNGKVKGMLIVKKNSSIDNPIRLEFEASYIDERLPNQVIKFRAQKTIFCDDTAKPVPVLHVTPMAIDWNPLSSVKSITFEALMSAGKLDVTKNNKTRYFWYRKVFAANKTYSLVAITGSADTDMDVISLPTKTVIIDGKEVQVSGNKLIINPDLVGEGESYVCKAIYRADGLTSKDAPEAGDPVEEMAIYRRKLIPDVSYGMVSDPADENPSQINPQAIIAIDNEEVSNAEEFFDINWYVKTPDNADYALAATGKQPQINFTDGMLLYCTASDKGPTKILVDDNGNYLVDDDGAFIVGK